jgi:predicted NACHT family NTPase
MDPILYEAGASIVAVVKLTPQSIKDKVLNELKGFSTEAKHRLINSFGTYMDQTYERHSFFSSLIFPNIQRKFNDFYLPLTLLSSNHTGEVTETLVDEYPTEIIADKKDLLIVDTAGMGKSTLLKFLFLQSVNKKMGIPIFIELRRLSKDKDIYRYFLDQLKKLDGKVDEILVLKLLESGDFIFFLDGYDEIAELDRDAVTFAIKDFKQRINKNQL